MAISSLFFFFSDLSSTWQKDIVTQDEMSSARRCPENKRMLQSLNF